MKEKVLNALALILGTLFVLIFLNGIYIWQKFLTDPTIIEKNLYNYVVLILKGLVNVLTFNFGTSTTYGNISVNKILLTFLPHTLILVFCTIILTALVSIIYGLKIFLKDKVSNKNVIGLIFLASVPSFILAKILYIIFNGQFPNSNFPKGLYNYSLNDISNFTTLLFSYIKYLILPIFVLLISDGNLYQFFSDIRKKILQLKKAPFIEYKIIRGNSELYIFFKHILPHVMLSFLYQLKYRFVYLISSAAVVEIIFQRAGIGARLIEFAQVRTTDIKLVLGLLYIISLLIICFHLIMIFVEKNYQKMVLWLHEGFKFFKPIGTLKIWSLIRFPYRLPKISVRSLLSSILFFLILFKLINAYTTIGSDPRFIKNGTEINAEYSKLKHDLVDGWGNINPNVLRKISKFKYNTYVNFMNFDFWVLIKAGFNSLILGLGATILVLTVGLPLGIGFGILREAKIKNFLNQFIIGPFDIIPKFFILAIIMSSLSYSSFSHNDRLFVIIYIFILAFLHIPEFVKLISIEVESIKKKGFYISGLALGVSLKRKISVYILANIKNQIIVGAMRVFISVIFLETTLSYLGFYLPIKKKLYFMTLGSILNRYSMTLNFLSNDWAVSFVKLYPLVLATLTLIFIISGAQFILQQFMLKGEKRGEAS